MSTVLERPNTNTDPTFGLELVNGDEIRLESNRFLFLAMDLLDPYRKEDLAHLAPGGEELDNACLRRSTGGFLQRCTFAPLEFWGTPMPQILMPEGTRALKLRGEEPDGANTNGRTFIGAPNLFVPIYPGEMIVDALGLTGSERKGIVEISCLRDEDYLGEKHSKLQGAFWDGWQVPVELRLIEERIVAVSAKYADTDIRSAAPEMLQSIAASRRWAENKISDANTQVAQRVRHEWTYSYSARIRYLMAQLEVKPMYNGTESVQSEVAKALANSGLNLDTLAANNADLATSIGSAIAAAITSALEAKAVAALEVETPKKPTK